MYLYNNPIYWVNSKMPVTLRRFCSKLSWFKSYYSYVKMNEIPEVIRTIPLQYYLFFSTTLFVIGIIGVLTRRNAIVIFMCIELMLNAVNLLLTAFSAYRSDANGQVFVFFIMAVAAAEVCVGLAIIVMIYRNLRSTDINILSNLKW